MASLAGSIAFNSAPKTPELDRVLALSLEAVNAVGEDEQSFETPLAAMFAVDDSTSLWLQDYCRSRSLPRGHLGFIYDLYKEESNSLPLIKRWPPPNPTLRGPRSLRSIQAVYNLFDAAA